MCAGEVNWELFTSHGMGIWGGGREPPSLYLGDVIGDMNSRRGRVVGLESRGGTQIVSGEVPLKEMFGYATDLRSKSQGRATYSMQFSKFEAVPQAVSDSIIAGARG